MKKQLETASFFWKNDIEKGFGITYVRGVDPERFDHMINRIDQLEKMIIKDVEEDKNVINEVYRYVERTYTRISEKNRLNIYACIHYLTRIGHPITKKDFSGTLFQYKLK